MLGTPDGLCDSEPTFASWTETVLPMLSHGSPPHVPQSGDPQSPGNAADQALLAVGVWLRGEAYAFVTPSPATHARVNARAVGRAATRLQDVFGWSRPFQPGFLPPFIVDLLGVADALENGVASLRSKVRFSSLSGLLFAHSAYPTTDHDAVFFGPDTYRFARLIEHSLKRTGAAAPDTWLVDVGCGSGAGGIVASRLGYGYRPMLCDISDKALHFSWVNCALAGVADARLRNSDVLKAVDEPVSIIVANPPYLLDAEGRLYRDGGGEWGSALSTRILAEGLEQLMPGGQMILYTGVPIINGCDLFRASVKDILRTHAAAVSYEEIDPDVFGEELERDAYAGVERIAVVALVVTKRAD